MVEKIESEIKSTSDFMNICVIAPDDLTAVLFCRHIIKSLGAIPRATIHVVCAITHFQPELEQLGAKVFALKTARTISPWQDLLYIIKLRRFLVDHQINQVVNIIAAKQNIYGSIAARLAGVQQIYSWVNGLGQVFRDSGGSRFFSALLIALYKLGFSVNKRVWFNNVADRDLLISRGSIEVEKTYLSNFFLDLNVYSASNVAQPEIVQAARKIELRPNEKVVIMVARMIFEKGISEFCEAAVQVGRRDPSIRFLLIAPLERGHINSVPAKFVEDYSKRCNLTWVEFAKDVKPYYYLSSVAVLPSYYKEGGYPRALLEPMAMGKPIITTDTDGCRRTVEHGRNGFLIAPRDANALAEAILSILSDDSMRGRMGEYSRSKAEKEFDEARIVPVALRSLGMPIPASA